MRAEIAEGDATGAVAVIYEAIRRLWGVPYVSSLQRHLATRPGWLEWVWAVLGPAFASGQAQAAAWRAAENLIVPRLPSVSRPALRVWGVTADGETAIRATCASFVRVSPVNLVLAGLLRRLLEGERPAGVAAAPPRWTPPSPVGPLPALADTATLPPAQREVLLSLGTMVGEEAFVPGLYRMLAGWPAFLAHLATALRPYLHDAATLAARRQLLDLIDAELPAVFATLPALPSMPPMPPADEFPGILSALDGYRKTSPEMVVFGRMIAEALPAPEEGGR
jgi:hypothetical protein